jgi:amino acid transporter
MQQFIFFIISPFAIVLISLGFLRVETKHFEPFLAGGFLPVLKGIVPSWFAYSGPELITGLLYPFVTKKKQVIKMGLLSVVVLAVMYTTYTVIVQGVLGIEETIATVYPTIIAYREVNIPDTFIERLDGYGIILQIALYFLSLANLLYFSAFGCSRLMKLDYSRPVIILLVPVFYFIAMLPQSIEQHNSFFKLANYILLSGGLFILPLLLLIAKLRKPGG